MDVEDILKTIYRKGITEVGQLFLCFFVQLLYAIIALSPEQLVRKEWKKLNETEVNIYLKNEILIRGSQWDQMDISCLNLLFVLASKHLRKVGKRLEKTLEDNIRLIVTLRNNVVHDNIQQIIEIQRGSSVTTFVDAIFVKGELTQIISLYNDIFVQLRIYLTVHGIVFPEPKGDEVLGILKWLKKSVDVPNFLNQNIKDFENIMHKEISKLGPITKSLEKNMLDTEKVAKSLERVTSQQETNNQSLERVALRQETNTKSFEKVVSRQETHTQSLERVTSQQETNAQAMKKMLEEFQANVKIFQELSKTTQTYEYVGSYEIEEDYEKVADPNSETSINLIRAINKMNEDTIERISNSKRIKIQIRWFREGSIIVDYHAITTEENEIEAIKLIKKIICNSGVKGLIPSSIRVEAMMHSGSRQTDSDTGPSEVKSPPVVDVIRRDTEEEEEVEGGKNICLGNTATELLTTASVRQRSVRDESTSTRTIRSITPERADVYVISPQCHFFRLAVIICMTAYPHATADAQLAKELWEKLMYNVTIIEDPTQKKLDKKLAKIRDNINSEAGSHDSFILMFIGSGGRLSNQVDGQHYTHNYVTLKEGHMLIETLQENYLPSLCPGLDGMPKIQIVYCHDDSHEKRPAKLRRHAYGSELSQDPDLYCLQIFVDGDIPNSVEVSRESNIIRTLHDILMRDHHNQDLVSMLDAFTAKIQNKTQTLVEKSTLVKKLYFQETKNTVLPE